MTDDDFIDLDGEEVTREIARRVDAISAEYGRPYAYDRQGNPIGFAEYARQRGRNGDDDDPVRVASTLVGEVWVSTVWLGIDHGWRGPPLIFETMTFSVEDDDLDAVVWERYSTEEEAHAGHAIVVAELANRFGVEPIEEGEVQ